MKRRNANYRAIPAGAIRIDLPNATQVTDYTCGASALQAICSYFGVGPEDEWDYESDMRMPKTGADPIHDGEEVRPACAGIPADEPG